MLESCRFGLPNPLFPRPKCQHRIVQHLGVLLMYIHLLYSLGAFQAHDPHSCTYSLVRLPALPGALGTVKHPVEYLMIWAAPGESRDWTHACSSLGERSDALFLLTLEFLACLGFTYKGQTWRFDLR